MSWAVTAFGYKQIYSSRKTEAALSSGSEVASAAARGIQQAGILPRQSGCGIPGPHLRGAGASPPAPEAPRCPPGLGVPQGPALTTGCREMQVLTLQSFGCLGTQLPPVLAANRRVGVFKLWAFDLTGPQNLQASFRLNGTQVCFSIGSSFPQINQSDCSFCLLACGREHKSYRMTKT